MRREYYKSNRYNPDSTIHYQKCEKCGKSVDPDDCGYTYLPGKWSQSYLCSNCISEVADNNFKEIKDKDPEEIIDDFSEL